MISTSHMRFFFLEFPGLGIQCWREGERWSDRHNNSVTVDMGSDFTPVLNSGHQGNIIRKYKETSLCLVILSCPKFLYVSKDNVAAPTAEPFCPIIVENKHRRSTYRLFSTKVQTDLRNDCNNFSVAHDVKCTFYFFRIYLHPLRA